MGTRVVLHIGYGKTGTTWLQEKIFRKLGRDIYLGKYEDDYPSWLLRLNYLDDFAFQAQCVELRQEISALLGGRPRAIISSEAFTNFGVIAQQLERIRYIFADPRVVIVLRHPVNWLISNYKYCVEYEGFRLPLESYIDFGTKRTPFSLEKRPPFYLPDLYYSEVIGRYREALGADSVLVLRYEDFIASPEGFGQKLAQFAGVDLPDFAECAKERVLASSPGDRIEIMRRENMATYVRAAGFELAPARETRGGEAGVLPDELTARLRAQFATYCREYYPDLAE